MDKCQIKLTIILKAMFAGSSVGVNDIGEVNWETLYAEALDHQIDGIIFSTIRGIIEKQDKECYLNWKKTIIGRSIAQNNRMMKTLQVFAEFAEKKIGYLLLKGVSLSELYPNKEMRFMNDLDILIKKENLSCVKEILEKWGYIQDVKGSNTYTLDYRHKTMIPIGLHLNLPEKDTNKNRNHIGNRLWENPISIGLDDVIINVPDYTAHLIYLISHIAKHYILSGFGIRQVTDIAFFIDVHRDEIDWCEAFEYFEQNEIDIFAKDILYIIREVFEVSVFPGLKEDPTWSAKELLNDIFKSGVYGKKEATGIISSTYLYYNSPEELLLNGQHSLKETLRVLFPSSSMIKNKYLYAKKYKILLPIAWIHRITSNLFFRNDLRYKEKISALNRNRVKTFDRGRLLKEYGFKSDYLRGKT